MAFGRRLRFGPWFAALLLTASRGIVAAPEVAAPDDGSRRAQKALVASQSRLASTAGARILERGGNAVDSAVATALALAVTHPAAGNIGGGGFLVVLLPGGRTTSFDFRERAPLASRQGMFLDEAKNYDFRRHHWSHSAVGVPGSVAGLHLAHSRLGRLPWKELVEPAVELASRGFRVSRGLAESLKGVLKELEKYPASFEQFTRKGKPYAEGDVLVQADLARTLRRIRDQGPAGFYRGETAELIVREMRRAGGYITLDDLASYRAVERPTVRGSYRGREIISMGPPSSGGVALVEMLNILEGYNIEELGLRSAAEVHRMAEAMRRAFADRARYLGDPDFVKVPTALLISKDYARKKMESIRPDRASKSSPERFEWPRESEETTHLSVVDADRMAVSLTTTLEQSYGSRIVVPGAGFLLNNEMGDFNPRAGMTTVDGHIGTRPNLVAPGKRMLSSMSPAIVARSGHPILVLGSPGGRTIINTVLEIIVNHIDHGLPIQQAIASPRFHHQWLPDRIAAEAGCLRPETAARLRSFGHDVITRNDPQGCAMGIAVLPDGSLEAGVDPRRPDGGAAGY